MIKGLFVPLCGGRLVFGPPPRSRTDLEYLEEELKVEVIVNVSPDTTEVTAKGFKKTESYMVHLRGEEEEEEEEKDEEYIDNDEQVERAEQEAKKKRKKEEEIELHLKVRRLIFDKTAFEPVGRTKELKKKSMGEYYATHIRLVLKDIKDLSQVIYIHGKTGVMEEAYIAFGLWKLISPADFPRDILQWIKEMNYEWLFNDDVDAREMMNIILERVSNQEKKNNFFKK